MKLKKYKEIPIDQKVKDIRNIKLWLSKDERINSEKEEDGHRERP